MSEQDIPKKPEAAPNPEDFAPDQFDSSRVPHGPRGVHRGQRALRYRLMPYVLIVIFMPLLALAAVLGLNYYRDSADQRAQTPSTTQPQSTDSTKDGDDGEKATTDTAGSGQEQAEAKPEAQTPAPETKPEATEPAEPAEPAEPPKPPEPEIKKTSRVEILNGTKTKGLAGKAKKTLDSDGYTRVKVGNYSKAKPSASTIYYRSKSDLGTAKDLAAKYGIDQLVENAKLAGSNDVRVILRGAIR